MSDISNNKIGENEFLKAYEEYSDPIFRFCVVKVRNREVALDIMQDTFTKTWEYLASGGTIDAIRAFLYRVARNLIVDYSRKKKTFSLDELLEGGTDFGVDNQDRMRDQMDGQEVLTVLDDIGKKYKDILVLRFIEELTIAEIAKILGESENSVSVQIHRGLKKAREVLEKREQDREENKL